MSKKRKVQQESEPCKDLRLDLQYSRNSDIKEAKKALEFRKKFYDLLKVSEPFPDDSAMALFVRDANFKSSMKGFYIRQCFERVYSIVSDHKKWACRVLEATESVRLLNCNHFLIDNPAMYIVMFMFRQNPRNLRCHKELRQFANEMQKEDFEPEEFDVENAVVLFNRLFTPLVRTTIAKLSKAGK